ncbi:UDP-glycosyltransferase 73C7-like [Impatiens glandulifera]|uniref:UDP-glycosyltransferase 73C7-like n=1 Tax=Impatiens glandulifera TaxID=253017 RepID=UPI001FB15D46|nr:UDP-glycosyltransferase 73C7-like [Impatiens glandulifera]
MANYDNLHIFIFPFLAPGHQIPMLDMAKLLAARPNIKVSMVTTTQNLTRFRSDISGGARGLNIDLHVLDFPSEAAGLPEGTSDNFDSVDRDVCGNFLDAVMLLEAQADDLVRVHRPDAIISDLYVPWTDNIARKYGIPRVGFNVSSCFAMAVTNGVLDLLYGTGRFVEPKTERFLVPGLPDEVFVTMAQNPSRFFKNLDAMEFFMKVAEAERNTNGIIFNTFRELEPMYLDHYKRTSGKKAWALGPYLLYNKEQTDMTNRGQVSNINKNECLTWLDSQKPNSVIYVAFGSLCVFNEAQLLELGLGLEESNHPFVWALRNDNKVGPDILALEERVRGRGLIIKGWAPQAMILDHSSVGGFLTHCGWNSTLEGICFGKPMLTWPLFADQFYNEILVIERLKMAFGIGVDTGMEWGVEDELGAQVKRDQVASAVNRLMSGGDVVEEMRERAKELSKLGKAAVIKGGSSWESIDDLIGEFMDHKKKRQEKNEI